MKKACLVLVYLLVLGFGIQIGNCQTDPCAGKIKILVKRSSDNSIMDAGIEVNGEDVTNPDYCYQISSNSILEVSKAWRINLKLNIEYLNPGVREIIFYFNDNDPKYTCGVGLLAGIYKYSGGSSTGLNIYNNGIPVEPYGDYSYSICMTDYQIRYRKEMSDLLKLGILQPKNTDTKIDVIIDDNCLEKIPGLPVPLKEFTPAK